jgi:hypothetical protein
MIPVITVSYCQFLDDFSESPVPDPDTYRRVPDSYPIRIRQKKIYGSLRISGSVSITLQKNTCAPGTSISIEWILYTGLLPVLAWKGGNIARSAKSIYIAAGLGNKKIS